MMIIVECCGKLIPFVKHVHDIAHYAALNSYKATNFTALVFCPFCGKKIEETDSEVVN